MKVRVHYEKWFYVKVLPHIWFLITDKLLFSAAWWNYQYAPDILTGWQPIAAPIYKWVFNLNVTASISHFEWPQNKLCVRVRLYIIRDCFELFLFFLHMGDSPKHENGFSFLSKLILFPLGKHYIFPLSRSQRGFAYCFLSHFTVPASLSELSLCQLITDACEIWAWWNLFLPRWKPAYIYIFKDNSVATIKTKMKVVGKGIQLWEDKNKGSVMETKLLSKEGLMCGQRQWTLERPGFVGKVVAGTGG